MRYKIKYMWTEWGKHLLNLALLVAGTLILRPLIQENTNKIFLIVGIILYIILILMGLNMIRKGDRDD